MNQYLLAGLQDYRIVRQFENVSPRFWPARALFICLLSVFALSGCATLTTGDQFDDVVANPFETVNRAVYRFNDGLDRAIIKPIAKGYVRVIPGPIRNSASNFIHNLFEPTTIVNDILQGKGTQAGADTMRFLFNSLFGIAGIFDVSTALGLPRHVEDFGQTLGKWGVGSGPYLVLPLIGPRNLRDTAGYVVDLITTDPHTQIDSGGVGIGVLTLIDTRADLLPTSRILDLQFDPYIFVRESYHQRRQSMIQDDTGEQ